MSSSTAPARLGKYEIRGTLGRGAMGTVFDGWDPVIDRRVAVKTVRLPNADDEEAVEGLARFKREAQAAGRLHHPNIVGVFDYGETDELAFIVMEFVAGRSLKDMLSGQERMVPAEAVRLLSEVLAGLAYSHGRGVVHRDIKPANVMVTAEGQAKIADFGIARIEASSMTQAGTIMGTPAYMSPEQFMGQVVDLRTDIYSCGVMLYQMLTGERPFEGSMTSIMHKAMTTTPPRPSELAVTAPAQLDGVVSRAMARRPEDRFADAASFREALLAPPGSLPVDPLFDERDEPPASDETVVAARPRAAVPVPIPIPAAVAVPPAGRAGSGGRAALALGAAAVLAAAGAGTWFALSPGTPPPAAVTAPAPALAPQQQAAVTPPPVTPTPVTPMPVIPVPGPGQPAPAPSVLSAPDAPVPPPATVPAPPLPPQQQAAMVVPPQVVSPQVVSPQFVPVVPPVMPPAAVPAAPPVTSPTAMPAVQPSMAAPPLSPPAAPPSIAPVAAAMGPQRLPAAIGSALAAALPQVSCTAASGSVAADGTAVVTGLAGAGQPETVLRAAVRGADPSGIAWRVQPVDEAFCPVIDLVRAAGEARLGLRQANGPSPVLDNQVIDLRVTMPGFAGFLHVAYLQHDGTVAPLLPGPGYPAQTYAAQAVVPLGQPRRDFPGWLAGPPFGVDMILAVASTAPLFSRPLPDSQPQAAYLSALQAAMEALRRRGGTAALNALPLETRAAR